MEIWISSKVVRFCFENSISCFNMFSIFITSKDNLSQTSQSQLYSSDDEAEVIKSKLNDGLEDGIDNEPREDNPTELLGIFQNTVYWLSYQ